MPDWMPLCIASQRDNPLARRLTEIEEAESWLDLNPEAAFECCHRVLADARSAARLAEALTLIREALRRDLAIPDGPELGAGLTRASEAYRSGTMPADERRLWDRYLLAAAIGTQLQSSAPAATAAPQFDEEPIRAELVALSQDQLDSQSGQLADVLPTPVNLAAQEAILGRYRALLVAARASQKLSSDAAIFAAHAAYRLGRGWRQLGKLDSAIAFFSEAGSLFDLGGYSEESASARQDAEDLRHVATTDIDRASAEDLRRLIGGTLGPLARAQALVRLSQFATDANAKFDAEDYAQKAAAILVQSGYPDPEAHGVEAALEEWIAKICRCAGETGIRPEKALAEIGRMYADILAARHGLKLVSDASSAAQIEATVQELGGVILQGLAKLSRAREEVAAKLVRYLPQLKTSSADPVAHFGLDHAGIALSDRLYAIQLEANDAQSAGDAAALATLSNRAADCLVEAQQLGDDFAVSHACFIKAYVYSFMGAMKLAISVAIEGEDALLHGVPATPERYLDRRAFNMLLELRGVRIGALLVEGDDKARLSLAQDCIKLIEARRYQIADPLQQGAFLTGRTFFYEMCVHAAFRLERWDDLLAAMELIKARTPLQNRLAPPPILKDIDIDARLAEVTKMQNENVKGSDAWLAASAQRRLLLNVRAIERKTGVLPPPLSIHALQGSLASTEAAIAWVWVSDAVLIVLAIRQQDVCADRVALTPEEVKMLDAYVNLLRARQFDLAVLEAQVTRLVSATLPEKIRRFIAGALRLILSPHRSLHLLPFHAGRWDDGAFLIEHAAVSYAPNLGSLLVQRDEVAPKITGGLIAVGINNYAVAGENWPDLKAAEAEAEEIAAIWTRNGRTVDALVGKNATIAGFDRLKDRLATCHCLHLATHGTSIFDLEAVNDPFSSRLILRDGSLDALAIGQLRLNAELVVLSACNAGQRALDDRGLAQLPGDDMFGLQAAFFEAGATAVIGALWPLFDFVAAQIMTALHAGLAAEIPADIALQNALVSYLKRPKTRTNIYFWAPIFLSCVGRQSGRETHLM